MSHAGKKILITGSLGGIGSAIGAHFAAQDAQVILTDLDVDKGVAAAEALGPGARFLALDVTAEDSWTSVMGQVEADLGPLDYLINAAGVFKPKIDFLDMTLAEWRWHFSVNLDGAFLGCQFGIKSMQKAGGGSIVNFSSGLAHIMLSDAAAYCTSKAALITLTRLAAKVGAPDKVRVNALLPGAIETPMMWSNLLPGQDRQELIDLLLPQHPIGRLGQPSDIAGTIDFLCSDAAGFITGAMLPIDGGQLL